MPLNIMINNRSNEAFNGKLVLNVFENKNSVFKYEYNVEIEEHSNLLKIVDLSIAEKNNNIIVQVVDENDEVVSEERLNIDLSSLDNRIIIGAITNNFPKLNYFDNVPLRNGNIKTKLIDITEDIYYQNRNILEQLDCIIISGISSEDIGSGLSDALESFLNNGKIIFLGTGQYGDSAFPIQFRSYIYGPSVVSDVELDFNYIDDEEVSNKKFIKTVPVTFYNINDNITFFENNDLNYISNLYINNGLLSNSIFDYCDLNDIFDTDKSFIIRLLEETFGNRKLNQIEQDTANNTINRFENLKSLINVKEIENLPDTVFLSLILIIYFLILTIIIYNLLKNRNMLRLYSRSIVIVSMVFIIILSVISKDNKNTGLQLNYVSFIDLKPESSFEKAYLEFVDNKKSSFDFSTLNNNKIYPILENNDEPIIRRYILEDLRKTSTFNEEDNNININIKNEIPFSSNIFVYEDRNEKHYTYPIEISVNRFDGVITGRVTNKTDFEIKNASVFLNGKIIYLGNIKANYSVMIEKGQIFNAPIENAKMQSELMCLYPNTLLIEHYLINNFSNNDNEAKFFGFLDTNESINLYSTDVDSIDGRTVIIYTTKVNNRDKDFVDVSATNYNINNFSGFYDKDNNSILGNDEVINEYNFDGNYNIQKIYFENITDFDTGNIEYNVPFYGGISIFNYFTFVYDDLSSNSINYNDLYKYLTPSNSFVLKFSPSGKDILDRRISLPSVRVVASIK